MGKFFAKISLHTIAAWLILVHFGSFLLRSQLFLQRKSYFRSMNHEKLIDEVRRTVGCSISTPQDFDHLSLRIFEKTHALISVSTLKRALGYLHQNVQPGPNTLNALARYVGYESYEHFCNSCGDEASQSNVVTHAALRTETLPSGVRIRLTWRPGRVCMVRHLGGCRFEVLEAVNTKLSVGDTFSAMLIICHEPLYLKNLVHRGEAPVTYVAGRKDGIMFEVV